MKEILLRTDMSDKEETKRLLDMMLYSQKMLTENYGASFASYAANQKSGQYAEFIGGSYNVDTSINVNGIT